MEDNYASFFYLIYAKRMVLIEDYFYNYFKGNENSICQTMDTDGYVTDNVKIYEAIINTINDKHIYISDYVRRNLERVYARKQYHYYRDHSAPQPLSKADYKKYVSALDFRRSLMFRYIIWKRNIKLI